jgi:peptidoglycan hydrolase CwlO-like protein
MAREDTEIVASQLADLTRAVEKLAADLEAVRSRADDAAERADTQQERIDLAARELAEVSCVCRQRRTSTRISRIPDPFPRA